MVDIKNIKDAFLTDWDVKVLLKYGFENRKVTNDEINKLFSLVEILKEYQFSHIISVIKRLNEYYISKVYDSIWATYFINENGDICNLSAFRDLDNACINMIKERYCLSDLIIERFYNNVNKKLVSSDLYSFANKYNYVITKENKKTLMK